jgi:hypothetical protein
MLIPETEIKLRKAPVSTMRDSYNPDSNYQAKLVL